MSQEIERKFLVSGDYKSQAFDQSRIVQGYISSARGRTVRVRIRDGKGYLTIKGASDASGITRYLVRGGKHIFEVDEFYGENEGLVVAEVELGSEDEVFVKPGFIGEEVTGDIRYYNSQLMKKPYTTWS